MSYKPEVLVEGKWSTNSLVFATRDEAELYARDLYMRWMVPTDSRAIESNEPVNTMRLEDGTLKSLPSPESLGIDTSKDGWFAEYTRLTQ